MSSFWHLHTWGNLLGGITVGSSQEEAYHFLNSRFETREAAWWAWPDQPLAQRPYPSPTVDLAAGHHCLYALFKKGN